MGIRNEEDAADRVASLQPVEMLGSRGDRTPAPGIMSFARPCRYQQVETEFWA
jgi:hypothetical protein